MAQSGPGLRRVAPLPGLWGLDARQEPEQQVHDGRRSYVLYNKVHKVTFLLQEIHNLEENSHN